MFSRLQAMGVAGVKVDFFGGDGQSVMSYYQDIFEDAAEHGLMVNCHGATLPRGWQRTYPNLVTMEAVKGFEFVTFEQVNADRQPSNVAMLPFARNVFDPMDYTPVVFGDIPGPVEWVVLARRSGTVWYVAGVNGTGEAMDLELTLPFIDSAEALLVTDGSEPRTFRIDTTPLDPERPLTISLERQGGFVLRVGG